MDDVVLEFWEKICSRVEKNIGDTKYVDKAVFQLCAVSADTFGPPTMAVIEVLGL